PAGAARLSNTNDFPTGTTFNSIRISGTNYILAGSNIVLNAGINATNTAGDNSVYIPIKLGSNQTFTSGSPLFNFTLTGAINNNGKNLTFAGNGRFQVSSILSGAGGFIKTGSGSV